MTHEEQRDLVARMIDGEVDESERRLAAEHLEGCADCRAEARSLGAVKAAVARLEARRPPPEAVRVRIARMAASRRRPRLRWWMGVAAAGTAAAVVLGVLLRPGPDAHGAPGLADELVADHLRSVPEARPVEVASDEPRTIVSFFEGRVPFEPRVPELPGARLLGGRLCVIRNHPMQLLFYERGGETLSLFVSADDEAIAGCEGSAGYSVCQRRHGDVTLRLVGRIPPGEADDLLTQGRL